MKTFDFMDSAFKEAQKAAAKGEIPVGAVIVRNGEIIARGHNVRESSRVATRHAEIVAIEKACKKLSSWRLDDCEMYVTLEPCLMCYGAILNARIKAVYFGAEDDGGGAGKFITDNDRVLLNWTTRFEKLGGETRCAEILSEFFLSRRKK